MGLHTSRRAACGGQSVEAGAFVIGQGNVIAFLHQNLQEQRLIGSDQFSIPDKEVFVKSGRLNQ
jgi:hypothetical protein